MEQCMSQLREGKGMPFERKPMPGSLPRMERIRRACPGGKTVSGRTAQRSGSHERRGLSRHFPFGDGGLSGRMVPFRTAGFSA